MGNSWKHDRAKEHIDKKIGDVEDVTIADYKRDTSLERIPTNKAYRMDAVHLYVDILNLDDILGTTATEGTQCHKRAFQFLNQHYRAVHRILQRCEAIKVDFHNQRLHAVIAKPYGDDCEVDRVDRAVAIGQLIIDVLEETGDEDENIPNADVRIGIDTGRALVVNNGRSGNREPLFLGSPANRAAKLASNGSGLGIYLTDDARATIGLTQVGASKTYTTPLTESEIDDSENAASLDVTKDAIVREWREDLEKNPIGSFSFTRSTPPLRKLDISVLTPSNSRQMETVSVYADIDNFTRYVDDHIDDDPEDVVRCLHVIRSELDRVLSSDFGGRRIRFIGDCVHGHLLEGTAHETDAEETVSTGALCSGGLRSSFNLALDRLKDNGIDIDGLGLAIGFEYGPTSITRLGIQGSRVRCSLGRTVLAAEEEQSRCTGKQTAIGEEAYEAGNDAVRKLFGTGRRKSDLDYDDVLDALAADNDKVAKAARAAAYAVTSPSIARAAETPFRPFSRSR